MADAPENADAPSRHKPLAKTLPGWFWRPAVIVAILMLIGVFSGTIFWLFDAFAEGGAPH